MVSPALPSHALPDALRKSHSAGFMEPSKPLSCYHVSHRLILCHRRDNHGPFTAQVDSLPTIKFDGFNNPNVFQQLLFNMTDLAMGAHQLTLIDTGTIDQWFDIDYITWETVRAAEDPH